MAITTTEATQIKKLVAAMFNLAPSAAIYNDMVTSFEAGGNSLSLLATNLSASGVYQNQLAGLDTAGLANKLMTSLGLTAGTTAGDAAYDYFVARLDAGVTLDQVAVEAVTYLADDSRRNAAFDDTVTLLNNKVTVIDALIASNIVAATTADLDYVDTVTADTATVDTATAAIDAANPANVGSTFTLTTSTTTVDDVLGTSGNDTYDASTLGTLQNGDSIFDISTTDNDTLNALINGTVTPTSIKNVENINITAKYGTVTFDAGNVSGVEVITVDSAIAAGSATVDKVVTGSVVASTNITSMTVKSKVTGTTSTVDVNGGSATTLTVTSENGTETGNSSFDVTASAATSVDLTGADKNDTFVADLAVATALTAAGGTGNDSYTITLGAAATVATIDGGAGNDTYVMTLANGTNTITTADGGAGTDAYTLNLNGGTLAFTSDATTETLNIVSGGAENTVNATGTVTTTTGIINISGSQNVTLKDTSANLTGVTVNNTNTGTTTVKVSSTTDGNSLAKVATSAIIDILAVSGAHYLTFKDGAQVKLSQDSTVNALELASETDGVGTINVTLAGDASIADEAAGSSDFQTIAITNADTGIAATALTAAFDNTATTGTTVTLAGSHALTLANTSTAMALNASSMTGVLTAELNAGLINITAGSGADVLTIADADLGSTSVNLAAGAGNDTVILAGSGTMDGDDDETLTIDGGDGTDTLKLTAAFDFSSGTTNIDASVVTGFEKINLNGFDLTMNQKQLFTNGSSFELLNDVAGNAGTFTLEINTDASQVVDLSSMTYGFTSNGGEAGITIDGVTAGTAVTITATSGADTITGSNAGAGTGNDTITAGNGADNIDAGTGADTIILTETTAAIDTLAFSTGDSTEAAMDTVTGFSCNATTGDNLNIVVTTLAASITSTDVSGVTSEAGDTVTASTSAAGIMTLAGANAANINTLAEWIDAAEVLLTTIVTADGATGTGDVGVLAFEFNGNTYVIEGGDAASDGVYVTGNVIQLTGLTGVTALSTTAAANTIDIA